MLVASEIDQPTLSDIIDILTEAEDYFDAHSDADCEDGRYIPNREMRLLIQCRDLLDRLGVPCLGRIA
jgi:hypothetical protein